MNSDKAYRRYVGQPQFTCHRLDLQQRPHPKERGVPVLGVLLYLLGTLVGLAAGLELLGLL